MRCILNSKHSVANRVVGTLPIIFPAKTLGFCAILIALPVENPESLTTFFIGGKSAVSKCLSRKDLAPRGGFEPPTFRLTAEWFPARKRRFFHTVVGRLNGLNNRCSAQRRLRLSGD